MGIRYEVNHKFQRICGRVCYFSFRCKKLRREVSDCSRVAEVLVAITVDTVSLINEGALSVAVRGQALLGRILDVGEMDGLAPAVLRRMVHLVCPVGDGRHVGAVQESGDLLRSCIC